MYINIKQIIILLFPAIKEAPLFESNHDGALEEICDNETSRKVDG